MLWDQMASFNFEKLHQISLIGPLLDDYILFDTFNTPSKSEFFFNANRRF